MTHLPQVASQAHHHLRVEKSSRHGNTSTEVFVLDDMERIDEIARMLSGDTVTEAARDAAKALMS